MTVYADVLFIINAYVSYVLMLLCALISGSRASRLRLTLTSLMGGVYSFIILIPHISDSLIALSRIPMAVLLILSAFGFKSIRSFLRQFASFFLVNFVFAGIMLALWLFVYPQKMYLGGFIVYFDIDPLTLIILTALCFFTLKAITSLVKLRQPKTCIYDLSLSVGDMRFSLRGFYDTGNSLCDPFTGKEVIIVTRQALKKLFPREVSYEKLPDCCPVPLRLVPCRGITGTKLLLCFTGDNAVIKGISLTIGINKPVIAVTDEKIKGGDYDALLPKGIFDNESDNKGEVSDEADKNLSRNKKQNIFTCKG